MTTVTYAASPTCTAFHESRARIKLLVGPVGSGSSSACLFDCIFRALRQSPDPDGVRRRTVLIARNSYPKLRTTVKRTMEHWLPDSTGFDLSGQAPIFGHLNVPDLGDGTSLELEFILMAFQDPSKIEDDLRSFEYSDLWINEAKENHPALLKYGQQRLGRAPAKVPDPNDPDPLGSNPLPPLFDGCDEPTIVLDTNMYDDDEWCYDFFHVKHLTNPDIVRFEQPPALMECESTADGAQYFQFLDIYLKENLVAENIRWLPQGYKYYWNIVETSPETVWTDVMNRIGSTQSGKPVFSSFYYNDNVHYTPLAPSPNPSYPLIIGVDWGIRYSAYVFCQYIDACLHIYHELVIQDIGLTQQMDDYVIPLLNTVYGQIPQKQVIADPAGRAKDPVDGVPLYSLILSKWGIPITLAHSNKPEVRIDSMKSLLRREAGVKLYKAAPVIRKGMQGRYAYKQVRVATDHNETRYKDQPDKNKYSHPCDALCYVALEVTSQNSINSMENAPLEQDEGQLVLV